MNKHLGTEMRTKVFYSLVVVLFALLFGGCAACRYLPPDANTSPLVLDHEQRVNFWSCLQPCSAYFPAGIYKPVFTIQDGITAGVYYRSPQLFSLYYMGGRQTVIGGFFVPAASNKNQKFSIWWGPRNTNEELTINQYRLGLWMMAQIHKDKIQFRQ